MKYITLLFFALPSAIATIVPPSYLPPDDLYTIFNVGYGNRVLDDQGDFSPGRPIESKIRYPDSTSSNTKWLIRGVTFDETEGRNVSIRSQDAERNNHDTGGFVGINGSDIIEHETAVDWGIVPVKDTKEQFMIIKHGYALSALPGSNNSDRWPLAAQEINSTNLFQQWVFVPMNQVLVYMSENNLV
ncbi:hypothetical protein PNOK_0867600 [Pyrrhoderma noxium]|uniref:Ricin B lectin domain-containing protein n=1 Tax=Pyrrhoderma noxium TaxID=2282107 RepID=A0A286U8C1_9AGAM|nr:hypothetical protein PNOK_0867600 [Pyrrhoderma noxium]